jgi:Rps23 Pro-64 3,4-dihydroxylase Tpa1-like proline 4-hydroxylase
LAPLPPSEIIGKSHEQEADRFLSTATAAPGGLLIRVLVVTILRITLADQDSMQVSQLIDNIGPTDWFVIVLAEPGEPLFEQHQCPLNERLGATTFV